MGGASERKNCKTGNLPIISTGVTDTVKPISLCGLDLRDCQVTVICQKSKPVKRRMQRVSAAASRNDIKNLLISSAV
ncbi:hypothetical protein TNCV_2391821 [Trichonephila clavipes]|nr:hypothetical protein TNCV_2391821 [Trichonephila clavipes]